MLPPVLEIYVVWHRIDARGAAIAKEFVEHFHGTVFSGLIGGAIEVYVRNAGWRSVEDAPRPIPVQAGTLPAGIPAARFVAVVPIMGNGLAGAVQPGTGPWYAYLHELTEAQERDASRIGIFPYLVDPAAARGTRLGELLGKFLRIAATPPAGGGETEQTLRCRDLAQGIAQMLMGGADKRLTVFLSHTKRNSPGEGAKVDALVEAVREVIRNTRLQEFFDAADLQVGRDWSAELQQKAGTSALLAVRTDLYPSREWCQREMLTAKRQGMPVVIMDAIGEGEERGSFLMDHVPRVPARMAGNSWNQADIRRSLNLLVDECLKRALWQRQRELAESEGMPHRIAWWAPHAPEPITLMRWLAEAKSVGGSSTADENLIILHPDPPLGPDEKLILNEMAALGGIKQQLDIVTPRLLAARGG